MVSPRGLAKELDDAIRQSLDNEAQQIDRTPEMEEKARADQTIRAVASQALREEIAQKLRHGEYEKIMQEEKIQCDAYRRKGNGTHKVRLLEELTEQIRRRSGKKRKAS